MKLLKLFLVLCSGIVIASNAAGQANATLNILTLNAGLANQGGSVYVQVAVGNTGPVSTIPQGKLRAVITIPPALVSNFPTVQQDQLFPGWTVVTNTATTITICNSTSPIPANTTQVSLIKLQGNTIGGPTTIIGNLNFPTGICAGPNGSLSGDNAADNSSTATVQVVPAAQCTVTAGTVIATAGTIACNSGSTTLTANAGQPTNVEYSLNGGAFQTSPAFTVNAAGSPYTVTARRISDPACFANSNTVTVTEPPVLSASTSSTPATAGNNGTATVNPAGGTPNYTYLWDDPGAQTTQTAVGLIAGIYNVIVTDANGCITTATATVGSGSTPLTLTGFNAKLINCQPVLNWATENELNTDRFVIQREYLNNSVWTDVGEVAAHGNTTTTTVYNYTDKTINTSDEQVLYRLKMIDLDGHYKYSGVLHLFTNCKITSVSVSPNPARDGRLNVSLSGAVGNTEATLLSLSGQVLLKNKITNGTNYLDITTIAGGVYVLNIKDATGFNKNVRIFIQH